MGAKYGVLADKFLQVKWPTQFTSGQCYKVVKAQLPLPGGINITSGTVLRSIMVTAPTEVVEESTVGWGIALLVLAIIVCCGVLPGFCVYFVFCKKMPATGEAYQSAK